jgi:serine/threonine protein kinase
MSNSLDDLLLLWEECRANGHTVPAALCPESPADAAELERRLRLLRSLDQLLAVDGGGAVALPVAAPAPERIDRYEIRNELGHGSTGVVYQAWDPQLHRLVALKVLRPTALAHTPTDAARLAHRFMQEAQVLARLKHENIVRIYEPGLYNGAPYFVMECVTGGSLLEHRAALTEAGPGAVVPCLEGVARAVAYAHGQGVFHRDLKPANILLDGNRRPLVSDFGLAKLLDDQAAAEVDTVDEGDTSVKYTLPADDAAKFLTAPGHHPGTPPYMAPEQFDASFGPVGPATDVWALGVILYELLTGVKPFPGPTYDLFRQQVCRGDVARPHTVRPRLSRRLERITLRCLTRSPQERYASAADLAEDLAACRRPSRRRWLAAVAGSLILAPAGAALYWYTRTDPEQLYRRQAIALLGELQERRKVELVSSNPEKPAAHAIRSGQQHTTVKQLTDGLIVHAAYPCCLVELLPEVPLASYRIRVRLRRHQPLIPKKHHWGVYLKHRAVTTEQGEQHYFNAVAFSGPSEEMPPPPSLTLDAFTRPCLFCDLLGREDRPFRDFTLAGLNKGFIREVQYRPDPTNPWVEVEVTVHNDLVEATCRVGLESAVPLDPITPTDQKVAKATVLAKYPDLGHITPQQLEGTALGIYVRDAECVVQSFVVETIDD